MNNPYTNPTAGPSGSRNNNNNQQSENPRHTLFRKLNATIDSFKDTPIVKRALLAFWRDAGPAVDALRQENEQLVQALRHAPPAIARLLPTSRPNTTQSTLAIRDALADDLEQRGAATDLELASLMNILTNISPQFALEKLVAARTSVNADGVGCWTNNAAPADVEKGYKKINLRNTRYLVDGGKLDIQPYIHQLAIVAKGEAGELRLATQGQHYEVSHLCGNGGCFNPAHVTVESRGLNKARQTCQGARILVVRDITVHPCPHGRTEKFKQCILPTTVIPANSPVGAHFTVDRGGRVTQTKPIS